MRQLLASFRWPGQKGVSGFRTFGAAEAPAFSKPKCPIIARPMAIISLTNTSWCL